jgi:DMSO/TMAO reductase YedYZ molybdopterin-dependent catalytic subunit
LRQNGDIGIDDEDYDPSQWTLTVNNVFGKDGPVQLTMEDIKKLPPVTQITEMYCIEGWSIKVEWTGVRFVDFAAKYPPEPRQGDMSNRGNLPDDLVRYVALLTPDEAYYVGLDMASALHPQTLLCYEMNGEPLTLDHGAPLRLVIPVKYGVKNLKRIGTITYTDQKPADFWAEQGYDWYAGM